MSDTDYTETLLFTAFDDGSGKAPVYNLTGGTESAPLTRQGSRIAFKCRLANHRLFCKAISLWLQWKVSSSTIGNGSLSSHGMLDPRRRSKRGALARKKAPPELAGQGISTRSRA
jgi:hypothetical protein